MNELNRFQFWEHVARLFNLIHLATFYAFIFVTFNFFGELDPVRVCEGAGLLVDVVNV